MRHIANTLYEPTARPTSKLLALRLTKSLVTTGSYWYLLLVQALVLPWIVEVARFKVETPVEQRALDMFGRVEGVTNAEAVQAGKSILRIVLEVVKALGTWIPLAPYQQQTLPTLFKIHLDRMVAQHIKFPESFTYCK